MPTKKFPFDYFSYGFSSCNAIPAKELSQFNSSDEEILQLANSDKLVFIVSAFFPEDYSFFSQGRVFLDEIVAPFSRKNYYREIVVRLKAMTREYRESKYLTKSDVRFFANSRLPEKFLGLSSGLGFIGKNSLLIHPDCGSKFLIGGFILPNDEDLDDYLFNGEILDSMCGDCTICSEVCPAAAISSASGFDRQRCFQNSIVEERALSLEEIVSRDRFIYGCMFCQDSCPYNINASPAPVLFDIEKGAIPKIDIVDILSLGDSAVNYLEKLLKGTNLGMSWMSKKALLQSILIYSINVTSYLNNEKIKHINRAENEYIEILTQMVFAYKHSKFDLLRETATKLENYYEFVKKSN
ncbi:MAG: hypothetical protein JXR63_11855 [Spirochaetales bacterium]|nr:hypothetical protein [Spirochaetales bacterium]